MILNHSGVPIIYTTLTLILITFNVDLSGIRKSIPS